MIRSLFFTSIAILCFAISNGQASDTSAFGKFAARQDSLFTRSYQLRDTKTYNRLLDEFLAKYTILRPSDKALYVPYYINALYNLACTYSLLNDKSMALDLLSRAINAGYTHYTHMQQDTDLDNIRGEARFKTLLQPLREVGDYMYILRKGSRYNTDDQRALPPFTYLSPDDTNLISLRKAFNLDSIAGTGNEASRVINLLHWIHNLVPHDGMHENPAIKNALSLIAVCKRDKRGLNCRGLATVLNECYLSLGFKSRFITCLPKDSLGKDNDCHVINMVYLNSLKRWVWIDPTNEAYVMNEKGELLGIEEVRSRIIDNRPLIVNPDANWNHISSTEKEAYLYNYMAKNLYILECPVNSGYDLETRREGKVLSYIRLLPLDYFSQSPDKKEDTSGGGTTLVTYKTNNPVSFWQAP